MPILLSILVGSVVSYLIGAIPTAYLFGKALKGIDIRQVGSGNVGATNAFRVLGKGPGIAVLAIDIVKGILPVAVVSDLLGLTEPWMRIILGVVAVCGHNWTVFLNFKGGKGIATSFGVLIGLTIRIAAIRPVLLLTFMVWLGTFFMFGFVSLASIVAATFLPVLMVVFNQPFFVVLFGIVLCVFVVFRHRPNIKRLLDGKESRVHFPYQKKP